MLHDFEEVADSELEGSVQRQADVCVIGAGAAGILIATQLATAGQRVLLLEGGGLQLEQRSQDLYSTGLSGLPYRGAAQGRFRTYGGSTTQWGGQILELEDFDFEKRSHVAGSGWPFAKSELTAYYERALQFEGLRLSESDDARVWAGLGLSICDLGPEFKMEYSRWCPERDFATLHGDNLRNSKRLNVLYHANFAGFVLNDSHTSFAAVRVRTYGGRERLFSADKYVFCTGGIETVRLLLQPLDRPAPWQLNGFLGRHYQDHVTLNRIPIRDIATQPVSRYFGYAELATFRYHNKIRLSLTEQARAKSLNVAGTIGPFRRETPELDAALLLLREAFKTRNRFTPSQSGQVVRSLPAIIGQRLSTKIFGEESQWNRTMLTVHCEQSPTSSSAISLTNERDTLGLLRADVKWDISAQEIHSLRNYVRRARDVFAARRFAKVEVPKAFFDDDAVVLAMCTDSNHHMGGARMSINAAQGIVDPNLKLHGTDNGYVCSSAVFPTSGFSNPTHTLLALAFRLVDRLVGEGKGHGTEAPLGFKNSTIPQIASPSSASPVPKLGFGCSYLLGPGLDRAQSLRLLESAYDAGIRYFDTARLYGQGQSEALLGEFLRRHPDAMVGTKFGIEPPSSIQRTAMAAGRRMTPLAGVATWIRGSGKVRFDATAARASLERSLRALGREQVEVFLLHEPEREELVHDNLLHFLEDAKKAGKIGNFGIGGEFSRVAELYATRRAYTPVLQFEHSIIGPTINVPESFRIHYRCFAKPAAILSRRFAEDRGLCWWWSEMVGADLAEPSVVANLLLKAALDEYPEALTLFSSTVEAHVYASAAVAADASLSQPAQRLHRLIAENDLGIGEELYGFGG